MAMAAIIGRIALGLAVVYALLLTLLFVFQSRLVHLPYLPGRELVATPERIGLQYEDVHLRTADEVRLHGWFVPAERARGVLLFFHGNAGNISHRLDSLAIFNELELDVLIIDYRGYGQSEGRPSEEGLYRDAEAALAYLREQRGFEDGEVVVFGRSLGAAVASRLASGHDVGALIVESAFTSVPDMAAELYPIFPVRTIARLQYDTRTTIKRVRSPVLVVHSPDDEIIPFRHGQTIYQAASSPKQFLQLRGDHNTGFLRHRDMYMDGLRQFLDEHFRER